MPQIVICFNYLGKFLCLNFCSCYIPEPWSAFGVRAKEYGDSTVWVLQKEPAAVRNWLTPSASCFEEVLDNRNYVFLINPDNRQLIDALEYESDISVVLINLNGRFLCLTWWDCGFEFHLGAWNSVTFKCCASSGRGQGFGLIAHTTKSFVNVTMTPSPIWHHRLVILR